MSVVVPLPKRIDQVPDEFVSEWLFRVLDSGFCQTPTHAARDTEDSLDQAGAFEFAMSVGGCSSVEMMCLAIGMARGCVPRSDRLEQLLGFFAHSSKIRPPSHTASLNV